MATATAPFGLSQIGQISVNVHDLKKAQQPFHQLEPPMSKRPVWRERPELISGIQGKTSTTLLLKMAVCVHIAAVMPAVSWSDR